MELTAAWNEESSTLGVSQTATRGPFLEPLL